MIEKINKYWNIMMILILIIIYIFSVFIFGGLAMDKGVGKYHYSKSLEEAKKENTLITKYLVYNTHKKQISNAWLEYARSYNIFNKKKIQKDRVFLGIKDIKELDKTKDVYWKAFFKDKKLTVVEDKGIISIIGVDTNMDTIILELNKEDFFYIVAER